MSLFNQYHEQENIDLSGLSKREAWRQTPVAHKLEIYSMLGGWFIAIFVGVGIVGGVVWLVYKIVSSLAAR